MKPDWERDNDTLPSQSYYTTQRVVIDDNEAMVQWWLVRGNWINSEINFLQYCFIHQKSHIKIQRKEPMAVWWDCSDYLWHKHEVFHWLENKIKSQFRTTVSLNFILPLSLLINKWSKQSERMNECVWLRIVFVCSCVCAHARTHIGVSKHG
jgi:hypothetical protein